MAEQSFHWNNYFKPTPVNLQRIAALIRKIIAGATVTSLFTNGGVILTSSIVILGATLEELSNFFGVIAEDAREHIVIDMPSEIANQVTVTRESIPENNNNNSNDDDKKPPS